MQASVAVISEKERKRRAALVSGVVGLLLLLLFVLLKWPLPTLPAPVAMEFIEVNLGSGDVGSGQDQPQLPGDPAPVAAPDQSVSTPAPTNEPARAVATDDQAPADAPVIRNPANSRADAPRINAENNSSQTGTVAAPAPRPRAVMGRVTGGRGTGGNGADTYQPGSGEGIAGGRGDQGRVGGDPNGTAYSGTPRRLGVQVVSIPPQTLQDDFRENGKVLLDITVDEQGRLQSAAYKQLGSTLPRSSRQAQIALQRVRELRFPKIEGGFRQDIQFNFSVGN